MRNVSYETHCISFELDPTPLEEAEGANPYVELEVEHRYWQEGEAYGDTTAYRQESEIVDITGAVYDFEKDFKIVDEQEMSYGELAEFLRSRGVDIDREIDKVL